MSEKKKANAFFRRTYLPPLVKAGNNLATRIQNVSRAAPGRASKGNFANLPPEERSALGKRGAAKRYAAMNEVERLAQRRLLAEYKKKLPAAVRRRTAAAGGKARWASFTPEQREAERAKIKAHGMAASQARRRAEWPFPKMCPTCGKPLASWLSRRCRACVCREHNDRRKDKARRNANAR